MTKVTTHLKRYYRWRFSGIVTVPTVIALIIISWQFVVMDQEFFNAWSCDTLYDYVQDDRVPDRFPKHNELSEEQHNKLHLIIQECIDNDRYLEPFIP